MATNALDDTILDFCDVHHEQIHDTNDKHHHNEPMTELSSKLKKQLKNEFGVRPRLRILTPLFSLSYNPNSY